MSESIRLPDNGSMNLWASQSYCNMSIENSDADITYNVHMGHLKRINNLKVGDLAHTSCDDIALLLEEVDRDLQGFTIFKVMIAGKEFLYSTLELMSAGE